MTVAALIALVALVLVRGALLFVRRAHGDSAERPVVEGFVLSGYRTHRAFDDRRPDWQSRHLSGRDNALTRSADWVRTAGDDALVEVIRVDRAVGHVTHLVTTDGVELIDG